MIIDSESRNNTTVIRHDIASPFTYPSPFTGASIIDLGNFKNNGVKANSTYNSANGGSIVGNSTNSMITVANSASLEFQSFTYEAWVKPSVLGTNKCLLATSSVEGTGKGHPVQFHMSDVNKLRCYFGNSTMTALADNSSTYVIPNTNIIHIAVIRDNANKTLEFFFNGVSDGVKSWMEYVGTMTTATFPVGSLDIIIGSTGLASYRIPFAGNMYKWSLTNTILNASDIKNIFNKDKNRFGL
ncbi:MAG: LamG-like jellyroll fold domain-containing protein [Bacteroidia bacterium]